MILLRLLNPQGIAGLAASLCLALLLVVQKAETRHWRKQSGKFEQLYRGEQSAFAVTLANYRAAAEQARLADQANSERVAAEQREINQRTSNDFEARLADARARFDRVRRETAITQADSRSGGSAPMPGLSAPSIRAAEGPGEDRVPAADALIATEQAIQLDELIQWVRRQHAVDPNADPRSPSM